MRRYTEQYEYDPVGNFLQLIHQARTTATGRASYTYNEPSLIEAGHSKKQPAEQHSRRQRHYRDVYLRRARQHDRHAASAGMDWDFHDQLQHVDLAGGGDAYYVYDAAGQRVRKVIEKNGGHSSKSVSIWVASRSFAAAMHAGTVTLERETLHVMDDKQRIALVETRTQGNEPDVPAQLVRYQFGNHLGSASLELDDQAQIISYEEYYPYGSTSYQAGRSAAE